ncbi:hypothetical protein [Sinobaca sp. H24]|uniref:hypothetical protein n=1 Tax=Sinobaca sp. H24 TaxID=2923376 RepID=UPI00207A5B02|nr:hypothetical protein [Sinobaca sp. H24]
MNEWAALKEERRKKLAEQKKKQENQKEEDNKESRKEEWIDPLLLLDAEEKTGWMNMKRRFRNYEDQQGTRVEMKLEAFQQLTGNAERGDE